MSKRKVLVPQIPHRLDRSKGELRPLDISSAHEWGEVEVILTPNANPFTSMESIVEDLHGALEHMTSDDFLLLIGNPVIIGVMTAIAAHYADGNVKMLQWHGKDRCYNAVDVNLN